MIILWTYNSENREWVEQKNIFSALFRITGTGWKNDLLITTENSTSDDETIRSVIGIIRQSKKDLFLAIGLAHPTRGVSDHYLECGATEVWAINSTAERGRNYPDLLQKTRITGTSSLCPALHCTKGDPVELSVCGKRNNRLILVMHHFRKWCLAEYSTCPYWLDKSNEL